MTDKPSSSAATFADEFYPALREWMRSRDFRRTYRRASRYAPGGGSAHMGCPVAVKPCFVGRRHAWR